MRRPILAMAILTLAACATEPPPAPAPAPAPPPPRPAPVTPPPPPQASNDQCGARDMQHLVGRPRTDIPVPVMPNLRRVACTTCPVTQDYNPRRLNFFFDAETGIIREVKCG
jgi:hypothetical protein